MKIRFYDGICCWEEGSPTPILHIGWAKPMVATCSKFDAEVRVKVDLPKEEEEQEMEDENEGILELEDDSLGIVNNNYYKDKREMVPNGRSSCHFTPASTHIRANNTTFKPGDLTTSTTHCCDNESKSDFVRLLRDNKNNSAKQRRRPQPRQRHVQVGVASLIENLSEGCKENMLNVEFLLGRETKPFVINGQHVKRKKQNSYALSGRGQVKSKKAKISQDEEEEDEPALKTVYLTLHSAKMKGLKDLLCAEKLNTSAIQLQLTAQSQTGEKSNQAASAASGEESVSGGKRPRRGVRRE